MFKHIRAGLISLGVLLIVGGAIVLATKNIIILPVLQWIRSLTESQIDLYVSVWGRALVAIGIILFLAASLLFWLRKRRA